MGVLEDILSELKALRLLVKEGNSKPDQGKAQGMKIAAGESLGMSVPEAAEMLGVSVPTLRRHVDQKKIESRKVGGLRKIEKAEVERFFREGEKAKAAPIRIEQEKKRKAAAAAPSVTIQTLPKPAIDPSKIVWH